MLVIILCELVVASLGLFYNVVRIRRSTVAFGFADAALYAAAWRGSIWGQAKGGRGGGEASAAGRLQVRGKWSSREREKEVISRERCGGFAEHRRTASCTDDGVVARGPREPNQPAHLLVRISPSLPFPSLRVYREACDANGESLSAGG